MRILYLHQYFATPKSSGGTRSYEFSRRLIAKGHDVRIITSPGYLPDEHKQIKKTTTLEIEGIPVTVIPVAYSNEMSFASRIMAFIKFAVLASYHAMRGPRPDVIFATSTPLTIAIPGILAKWRWFRPMVFEVRDLWPELPIAIGALRNPMLKWVGLALEWVAYHSSKHVVALSPGMAAGVIRRGIPEHRVSTITNSCDTAIFDLPAEVGEGIRDELGIRADTPLVVYTGTFGHINGVSYLVEVAHAMKQVNPDVHFLIVGGGVEREKVESRARELGVLGDNLTLWRPVPKEKVPQVLAAATVATSLFVPLEAMWHNSANKFFDALASSTPVAINYGGWQADLLAEVPAGIVMSPEDPVRGAELLADFLADHDRLARATEYARELGFGRFSRDYLAEQIEQILVKASQ